MSEERPTRSRSASARAAGESAKKKHVNIGPPDETPLDYMLRIMRDPAVDDARRDAMAKAACAYIHSRAAGSEGGIMNTDEFRQMMEAAYESIISSFARLRTGES